MTMDNKDSIKKILLFYIPMSICNFRCHYCYLAQRDIQYQGVQPEMNYSPQEVARAMSPERLGGVAFMNFCADGETLLTKDIDLYIKLLVEEGHYAEIVTNLTVNKMIDKILSWDIELLKRVEFKCSFHYMELKKKGLLLRFVDNVKKVWAAGASANIEITPSDELIPYIEEVKEFSLEHFGALPHLTIARNDRTDNIDYLTNLSINKYDEIWSQFDSNFWEFKKTIFKKKQTDFCYAGRWSLIVDLSTGHYWKCYFGNESTKSVFANPEEPLPSCPVGKCKIAHCYNGHALLTMGLIPSKQSGIPGYGDIRDRECVDGSHWLKPELKNFFNSRLNSENEELNFFSKKYFIYKPFLQHIHSILYRVIKI